MLARERTCDAQTAGEPREGLLVGAQRGDAGLGDGEPLLHLHAVVRRPVYAAGGVGAEVVEIDVVELALGIGFLCC